MVLLSVGSSGPPEGFWRIEVGRRRRAQPVACDLPIIIRVASHEYTLAADSRDDPPGRLYCRLPTAAADYSNCHLPPPPAAPTRPQAAMVDSAHAGSQTYYGPSPPL